MLAISFYRRSYPIAGRLPDKLPVFHRERFEVLDNQNLVLSSAFWFFLLLFIGIASNAQNANLNNWLNNQASSSTKLSQTFADIHVT